MELIRSFNIDEFMVRKIEGDERTREFIISTERKDSHGTVLPISKWDLEYFNKAGAFYYQHQTGGGFLTDANPDNALGPATARIEGKTLIGVGRYEPKELNPLAEKIMGKVDFGTMKATSVGFLPNTKEIGHWGVEKNNEDPTTFYFNGQSLKEFSNVHIPSNEDAIKKALEPMSRLMEKMIEDHKSEGFRKDYVWNLRRQLQAKLLIN